MFLGWSTNTEGVFLVQKRVIRSMAEIKSTETLLTNISYPRKKNLSLTKQVISYKAINFVGPLFFKICCQ